MSFNKTFLKVLVLGDVAVGKSSLANRYVNQTFSYEYKVTIGADLLLKELEIDEKIITLQIWDTAGQERYKAFNAPFYRGADCALIVYDITDPLTFDHLEIWIENLMANSCWDLPIVVVGNRLDLKRLREISAQKAQNWCIMRNFIYFETSAKTGENVDEVFDCLVKEAMKQQVNFNKEEGFSFNGDKIILGPPTSDKEEKSQCC